MRDFFNNKRNLIISGVILLFVIFIVVFVIQKINSDKTNTEKQLINEEIVPTVDSNVKVMLEKSSKKGEVTLTIKDAPAGTKEIEYLLTYSRTNKEEGNDMVQEGAMGKCIQKLKPSSIWICQQPTSDEAIVLGTCSSGTCVYHEVIGDINVQLKFTGTYGERIYEKNFSLD